MYPVIGLWWSVKFLQVVCSKRTVPSLSHFLTWNLQHEVLGLARVHALYGQSRRVLGFFAFTGLVSFATTTVRLFPQASRRRIHIPPSFS